MSVNSTNPSTVERNEWAYRALVQWLDLEKTGSVTFHLHRGTIGAIELKERVTREDTA